MISGIQRISITMSCLCYLDPKRPERSIAEIILGPILLVFEISTTLNFTLGVFDISKTNRIGSKIDSAIDLSGIFGSR